MHFGAFLQPVLISVLLVLPAGCTLKSAGPGGRAVVHVERLADEGVYFHGVHVPAVGLGDGERSVIG